MTVEFHPAALREVEEAFAWYEERSLFAASAFLRALSHTIQRISLAPGRYPQAGSGTQRILMDRFPFTLYYQTSGDTLTVVAVAHQKRKPGYWSSR